MREYPCKELMKYLRKITALVIAVAFVAAVIICMGVIFAVKNVNVTLRTYDEDLNRYVVGADGVTVKDENGLPVENPDYDAEAYSRITSAIKRPLIKFKGESILFIKKSEVGEAIASVPELGYTMISCEKKYPCTLNIVVKQRLEIFAVYDAESGTYDMYDDNGAFLRTKDTNENSLDGEGQKSPNILLKGVDKSDIPEIAGIASEFKSVFNNALRSIVSSIELKKTDELGEHHYDELVFNMRCGLSIKLVDYLNRTAEKLEAGFEEFGKLEDRQKLSGTLTCLVNDADAVTATYKPN